MISELSTPQNITVVGLGYVGLPLALAFAKEFPTIGLDVDESRISELLSGSDRNREVPEAEITASRVAFTLDASCVADAEFIVVTVPTPVSEDHKPDLRLLESASAAIGVQLRGRSEGLAAPIIVFESTTYPGCTEGFCGPIIERESGLKSGEGFFLGYSPERANFGDQEHTLETVIKVVSGQTPEIAAMVAGVYGRIAKEGTHLTADIKTAEASKVIENVQRDLNIALFNELAMIFDRMDIRSADAFDAADTKWNFHRYQPGLVGGHCIPVDPYYLTHAASEIGFDARIVLAGREVNESVTEFAAGKISSLLEEAGAVPAEACVLILGLTFKPNVSDIRNSKAMMLAELLAQRHSGVDAYEPVGLIPHDTVTGYNIIDDPFVSEKTYDVVVLAVPHDTVVAQKANIGDLVEPGGLVVDLGSALDRVEIESDDRAYWSL
jgi:UDP-N-acetyl-D-galactosamine dehydrogenase